ncbi:hypothetical protein CMI37_15160 [Candidatus Pacearchaeota archaeon]|nr:hypothetical protein [Candidatus Pacearchaeota archaeon]|tara:strand:+ start:1659 stop:1895 length:237 start_codon:yes stop_codon:yes gene_type:complete
MTRIELIKQLHQDLLAKEGAKPIAKQKVLEEEEPQEEEVEEGQTEQVNVSDEELNILKHTQGYCRGSITELVDGDVEE